VKVVLQNSTDWSDDALKVVLRWVAKQSGHKKPFRIKVRNGKNMGCSYGQTITVRVPKRRARKFPFDYKYQNITAVLESRLQTLVWSAAWCLQSNCDRWDRYNLATDVLVRFKVMWSVLRKDIVEVLRKHKAKVQKQKTPVRCARYSAALYHLVAWEKRLKLAQTKVKKYQAIAARYERQFFGKPN